MKCNTKSSLNEQKDIDKSSANELICSCKEQQKYIEQTQEVRKTRKKLQKLILDLFDQLWFIVVVSVVLPVVSAVVGSVVGLELFSLILRMLQR